MLQQRRRWPGVTRRARRRALGVLGVLVVLLLLVPGVSFARAMTYPGSAPASVRAVEWVREHGGNGLVDRLENWWYTRHAPPRVRSADDVRQPARTSSGSGTASAAAAPAPAPPAPTTALPTVTLAGPVQPGEGVWSVSSRSASGQPLLYTTFLHPDPEYPTVVAGAALFPQQRTALHLQAGTREPLPGAVAVADTQVPAADRTGLVAVFNSGFKTKDSRGGWYSRGRMVVPLREGAASLVIDQQGRATVQGWQASDLTAQVAAVRQNLQLVVEQGSPVPGLGSDVGGRWGTSHNQLQYTWRSGVGTDAAGDLVYVAGSQMTLRMLAEAMARVGTVTGMELDMHTHMVAFNSFAEPATGAGAGVPLLPWMPVPQNRYLVPDQRDFFYVTAK